MTASLDVFIRLSHIINLHVESTNIFLSIFYSVNLIVKLINVGRCTEGDYFTTSVYLFLILVILLSSCLVNQSFQLHVVVHFDFLCLLITDNLKNLEFNNKCGQKKVQIFFK